MLGRHAVWDAMQASRQTQRAVLQAARGGGRAEEVSRPVSFNDGKRKPMHGEAIAREELLRKALALDLES